VTVAASRKARSPGIVLATALFGLFATNFNISVLAVVVPTLERELHTTKTTITWVVTGPVLAFAVFGPTAGKLGDLYGRRRVYLVGLSGTAVFAALAATATTPGLLIAFRTIAALFGSSTGPSGMAIISGKFSRERRVQALGYWGLVSAGGPVLGLVIGGMVADAFGWRWLFVAQVPLTLLALAAAALILPEAQGRGAARFDLGGSALVAVTVGGLLFAVNRAPTWGWSHPLVLLGLAACPLGAVAFALHEARVSHPLLPIEYFRRRNFAAPMGAQFLVNATYQGGVVLMPLMLAEVLHYSATHTSLLVMARPGLYAVAGPTAGWLAFRIGERRTAVAGAVLVSVSSLLLVVVRPGTSDAVIFAILAVAGAGLGAMTPPMTSTITTAVDDRDLGVAAATSQMMLQVGNVVGVQTLQTVQLGRAATSGVTSSYHQAFLLGGAVGLVGAVVASTIRSMDRSA
jgi:EmrB/QacA subfamily drug resistance transporter